MATAELVCTKCGKMSSLEQVYPRCNVCDEPLEVRQELRRAGIRGNLFKQTILQRYRAFLPFSKLSPDISLGEGFTALTPADRLATELGVKSILFKNESLNPTWSFKDRGTVAGVQHALSLGYRRIGTVSTGNMAVSVAAYGARAGLQTFVLITSTLPAEKINPIAIYHPILIKVAGDYPQLYYDSLDIGQRQSIYFINSDVPFRVEGSKTIAFEICEQMNFAVPDYVVVPTSAGGNLRGILKGFREFHQVGLIDRVPKMVCAQASGCSPIVNAFQKQSQEITRVENPHTIAHAIENPFPPSGNEVFRQLWATGGTAVTVTDDEMITSQRQLARIGIFAQPDSAVPLAAVRKLRQNNFLTADDTVVCIITGGGLKDTSAFQYHKLTALETKLEDLDTTIARAIHG